MTYAYQLKNVQFHYYNTQALSLTDLTIPAGKVTALVGPNGCGKSTLLNLLAFLQNNQQGDLLFFSQPVSRQQMPNFIRRIAFLPQQPYMLRGTVFDNLVLAIKFQHIKNDHKQRINAVLAQLEISHLKNLAAKTLSGGELQKVALARAIITEPEVLLMDEPFSFLDHTSEQRLEQFIADFVKQSGQTLIFSTHNRLQGIAIADNVISLVKGKPVKTALINLFHGHNDQQFFNTGKIKFLLPDGAQEYHHVSIDPHEIVLSRLPLQSSMRNQFQGKVTAIADEMAGIRVSVSAGELFQVLITHQAFEELHIALADQLWVNFKSNSIHAF